MAKSKTTRYTNPVLIIDGGSTDSTTESTNEPTIGTRIAAHLTSFGVPAVIASPSGAGPNGVRFDWHDASTWASVFEGVPHNRNDDPDKGIRAVYLVAPSSPSVLEEDVAGVMMDFVDFARGVTRGGKRFVLQSASGIEAGGPALGKVHAYLRELGARGEVEWAVLRPTWFQRTSLFTWLVWWVLMWG
jgi:festuclavine dehydrogenase